MRRTMPSAEPTRGGTGRPRSFAAFPSPLALVLTTCAVALLPATGIASEAVTGRVVDAATGEPIPNAWVFEAVRAERLAADVRHFRRVREVQTDADGRFRFEPAPQSLLSRLRARFSSAPPPRYHVYHPSYGLVWGREDAGTIRLDLRNAHLRQMDAKTLCVSEETDALHERVQSLACPPARPDEFANGRPRAEGELDRRGRRTGEWTFYREDGSTRARGRYVDGGAAGEWKYPPPPPSDGD